ncbi:MAG TPA: hypothetical protein PKC13_27255 [Blastocatellia bacterium]|nr:hypothetical protein [Blastocatellia bacterium]HMY76280.1 hypothetical protein [Blastocatellia bacterium]
MPVIDFLPNLKKQFVRLTVFFFRSDALSPGRNSDRLLALPLPTLIFLLPGDFFRRYFLNHSLGFTFHSPRFFPGRLRGFRFDGSTLLHGITPLGFWRGHHIAKPRGSTIRRENRSAGKPVGGKTGMT